MSRKDDRILELEGEIEFLGMLRDSHIRQLEERSEYPSIIEGLAIESDDRARELDKVHAAVLAAITDLRNLQEVPAGDLFQSIGEIVGALRAVLV